MKAQSPVSFVPVWERCSCCEKFVCNLHPGKHASDCDCKPIEELDFDPYTTLVAVFEDKEET